MRNLIISVPLGIIYSLFFVPFALLLLFLFQFPQLLSETTLIIFNLWGLAVFYIWAFSLIDYFRFESKSYKWIKLLKLLLTSTLVLSFDASIRDGMFEFILAITALLVWIVFTVLLSAKIKRVFYARSRWFIFLEIFIPVIGVLTLTPEIKRWEKSDKT
ncbi:MAG: hypothetical protein ACJASQ_000316 [Crocinitomicaceae bacterium]|jgi:hypothetical protein